MFLMTTTTITETLAKKVNSLKVIINKIHDKPIETSLEGARLAKNQKKKKIDKFKQKSDEKSIPESKQVLSRFHCHLYTHS